MKWHPHILLLIVGIVAFNWIQPYVYRKISNKVTRWIVCFFITFAFAVGVLFLANITFRWK